MPRPDPPECPRCGAPWKPGPQCPACREAWNRAVDAWAATYAPQPAPEVLPTAPGTPLHFARWLVQTGRLRESV